MKLLIGTSFVGMLLIGLTAIFWTQEASTKVIIEGWKQGDASAIAAYFDNEVELMLPQVDDSYDKIAAKTKLEAFFVAYPTIAFNVLHEGESPTKEGKYIIGLLETKMANFRIYLLLKNEKIIQIEARPEEKEL